MLLNYHITVYSTTETTDVTQRSPQRT